jgi:hypothetical protein
LLALSLQRPDGTTTRADPECPSLSFPGVKGRLAAGATESRVLDLHALLPVAWKTGRYTLNASWVSPGVGASSGTVQALWIAAARTAFRIPRGEVHELPDGARLAFDGHGHKQMIGDQPSPLIIRGRFAPPHQAALEPFEVKVETQRSRFFRVRNDYVFALAAHGYDEWMQLAYYGALPE